MKYRPGSEGAKQERTKLKMKIAMAVIGLLIALVTFTNLFHTNFFMWMSKADGVANVFGLIIFIASLLPLYFENWIGDKLDNDWMWFVVWFVCILAGLATSCGFNFSL